MRKSGKRYLLLALVFFILFFLIVGVTCLNKNASLQNHENKLAENIEKKENIRPLDGLYYFGKYKFLPIGVMYDNLDKARPQAGLSFASIVYEAPVEAGITRFLAIFDTVSLPEKIGPIRSARPYFAEIAEEYKGIYVHAGGSPEVLRKIKMGYYDFYNVDDLSAQGIYFWRDYSKKAPHNLYLNVKKFLNSSWGNLSVKDFDAWKFEDSSQNRGKVNKIEISYSEPVEWKYDNFKNQYFRYQNNKKFIDENGEQISTENVVVQITDISIIDDEGRRKIRMKGEGRAVIFKNGKKIYGFWKKLKNGRTHFFDNEGKEVKFNRGRTWIEIVSKNISVKY